MSKAKLQWLTIVLPIAYWAFVVVIANTIFHEYDILMEGLFSLVLVGIGALAFSFWVFSYINKREDEIRLQAQQLAALNSAALALTTELDLGVVLQKVVDISCQLVNAEFGALGVLNEEGTHFEQFITSGISEEKRAQIGLPPQGHGVFRILIEEGKPLRVNDIQKHDRAVGFPPKHPSMKSLMGVPIVSKGEVIGDLYLSNKISKIQGGEPVDFDDRDQQLLETFGIQVAIAIENARLYRQVQELVVLRERERFGMDLHDGVIQSIYAIGLMLDDVQRRLNVEEKDSKKRINHAISGLNDVISDIRNYILDLRPQRFKGKNLVEGLKELTRALRANTFMNVNLDVNGVIPEDFTPEQTVEILHIAQEAMSNVRRHARATSVDIKIEKNTEGIKIVVEDNGVSITKEQLRGGDGDGLGNMRERAKSLGGEFSIQPRKSNGTRVRLTLPHQ